MGAPNGKVTWGNQRNGTVWVNIGRVDALARQVTFGVYAADSTDVTATGSTASYTDHSVAVPQRFYRVVLVSDLTPLTPLAVVANSSWRPYGAPNPAGTNGQWTFTESSSSFPRRFFRAATP